MLGGSRRRVPHSTPGTVKLWVPPRQSRGVSPVYARETRRTACVVALGAMLVAGLALDARAQNRMPPIPPEEMTDAQRELVEWYAGERNGAALVGPWVPLSRSPEVARLMIDVRSHVASRSLLSPSLTEIPILIAARAWSQQFEWNAHTRIAERAGLSRSTITAIAGGYRPPEMSDEEEVLYDLCMELDRTKGVSDPTYAAGLGGVRRGEHRRSGGAAGLLCAAGHGHEHCENAAAGEHRGVAAVSRAITTVVGAILRIDPRSPSESGNKRDRRVVARWPSRQRRRQARRWTEPNPGGFSLFAPAWPRAIADQERDKAVL